MENAITHPVWCDPDRCTAPAVQPTMEHPGDPRDKGQHRSALVADAWGEGGAYLMQAVAPWGTAVYLVTVDKDDRRVQQFQLEPGSPLLLMVRQLVAEQQNHYPSLVPPLAGDPRAARAAGRRPESRRVSEVIDPRPELTPEQVEQNRSGMAVARAAAARARADAHVTGATAYLKGDAA